MTITEAMIRAEDKKIRPPKCKCCKEIITGKTFPGTLCNRCFNET